MTTELLVHISMRFPSTIDQGVLGTLLMPVVRAAVDAGGLTTNLSVQSFDPSPAVESRSHDSTVHADEEASSPSPTLSVAPHGSAAPCGSDR